MSDLQRFDCCNCSDCYSQAPTYHQLGIVAQKLRQWAQAEAYYQQALAIYVEFNDRYERAGTHHHLGAGGAGAAAVGRTQLREYHLTVLVTYQARVCTI